MDVGHIQHYAWGAAALAYLYRQLGQATRIDFLQITEYLTLLQAWVYEHFPFARPRAQIGYTTGEPLACRWYPSSSSGNMMESIQLIREARRYPSERGSLGPLC